MSCNVLILSSCCPEPAQYWALYTNSVEIKYNCKGYETPYSQHYAKGAKTMALYATLSTLIRTLADAMRVVNIASGQAHPFQDACVVATILANLAGTSANTDAQTESEATRGPPSDGSRPS